MRRISGGSGGGFGGDGGFGGGEGGGGDGEGAGGDATIVIMLAFVLSNRLPSG
jgi:hypothetical protein